MQNYTYMAYSICTGYGMDILSLSLLSHYQSYAVHTVTTNPIFLQFPLPPLPFPPSLSHSQLTAGDGHFSLVRTRAAHCTNWIGVVAPQEVTFMTIAMNLVKKDGAISLTIATPISRE